MIKTVKESVHKTVLLNETIEGLNLKDKSIVLDATFGGGGHSKEILEKYSNVKIIALDQDKSVSKNLLDSRISFHNLNFRDLDKVLEKEQVDGIIFDLGLSSDQLENSGRGFSFMKDEPLLMTMKENPKTEDLTAKDIVNSWGEKNLADIIYGYGEERFSRRIAKGIVEARKKNKIETTKDLVKVIEDSVPAGYKKQRLHFATKTFQALRIAVNDELGALQIGLEKGFGLLKKQGRMSVISFHSLEDRIVKRFFKEKKDKNEAILINKKPIGATAEEIKSNPRSRSAKLRILEKII
jgi:16S rRNA (cytosine1402-N4)-methyltransferase